MTEPENTHSHHTHSNKNISATGVINLGVLKKLMGQEVSENDWRQMVPVGGIEFVVSSDTEMPDHPLHDPDINQHPPYGNVIEAIKRAIRATNNGGDMEDALSEGLEELKKPSKPVPPLDA